MDARRPKEVAPELLRAHLTATRELGDSRDTAGRYETLWTEEEDERHGPVHVAYEVWNNHLVTGTHKKDGTDVLTLSVTLHPLRRIDQVTLKPLDGDAIAVIGGRVHYVPLTIGQRILAAG